MSDLCVTADEGHERRALPGLRLCGSCRDRLERQLGQLPTLYAQLGHNLGTGGGAGQRVTGTSSRPLPINPAVADHRDQIRHDLVWWCVFVADERGMAGPQDGDPATTAVWLVRHVEWAAATLPAAEEMPPVVRGLTGRARALLDPSGAKRIRVGPCQDVTEDGVCGGVLYATVRAEDDVRPSVIFCDTCEMELAAESWLRFGREYLRVKEAS